MKPEPDETTFVIVSLASPVFERVMVAEFVVPTTTLPKAMVDGVALIEPGELSPVEPVLEVPVPPGANGFVVSPTQPAEASKAKRAAETASPWRDAAATRRAKPEVELEPSRPRVRGCCIAGPLSGETGVQNYWTRVHTRDRCAELSIRTGFWEDPRRTAFAADPPS